MTAAQFEFVTYRFYFQHKLQTLILFRFQPDLRCSLASKTLFVLPIPHTVYALLLFFLPEDINMLEQSPVLRREAMCWMPLQKVKGQYMVKSGPIWKVLRP